MQDILNYIYNKYTFSQDLAIHLDLYKEYLEYSNILYKSPNPNLNDYLDYCEMCRKDLKFDF